MAGSYWQVMVLLVVVVGLQSVCVYCFCYLDFNILFVRWIIVKCILYIIDIVLFIKNVCGEYSYIVPGEPNLHGK